MKALAPLKKSPSLSASLSDSPKGSPNKSKTDSLTAKKDPKAGLSLKLGGANFLKAEAKELLLSDDDTDRSVPQIISVPKDNVKSILKSSPKRIEPTASKRTLKISSSTESGESSNRRIQFNIQPEEKKKEAEEIISDESSSVAIDDVQSKKSGILGESNEFLSEFGAQFLSGVFTQVC